MSNAFPPIFIVFPDRHMFQSLSIGQLWGVRFFQGMVLFKWRHKAYGRSNYQIKQSTFRGYIVRKNKSNCPCECVHAKRFSQANSKQECSLFISYVKITAVEDSFFLKIFSGFQITLKRHTLSWIKKRKKERGFILLIDHGQ